MAGRPSKITEAMPDFLEAIRLAMSYEDAARAAGIGVRTAFDWRKRGENELRRVEDMGARGRIKKREKPYVDFVQQLERARAYGKMAISGIIHQSAAGGAKIRETKTVQVSVSGVVVEERTEVSEKELGPDWRAAAWIAHHRYGMVRPDSKLNIPLDRLTEEELQRIIDGENPLDVIPADIMARANEGGGGKGE